MCKSGMTFWKHLDEKQYFVVFYTNSSIPTVYRLRRPRVHNC